MFNIKLSLSVSRTTSNARAYIGGSGTDNGFYMGRDCSGMTDELTMCAAAYFRSIGKDVASTDEFVMDISLELKWMPPSDAKLLLSKLVAQGIVQQKDGYVRPSPGLDDVDIPLAYRPSKELIDAVHSKSQTPVSEKKADDAGEDIFPRLMNAAVGIGMERRDFIQGCNKIQKRLDIEVAVAALLILRGAGADITPYLDAVYDSLKVA